MLPQWFAPDNLPLDDMWEETRIWMLTVLGLYLPQPGEPSSSPHGEVLPTEVTSPVDGNGDEGDKKWFIHYVDFRGGVNAQTGEWDAWHGMGTSVWEWFDKPLDSWSKDEMGAWVDKVRRGNGGLLN